MNIKRRVIVMALVIICSAATYAQSYMKLSNVTVRKAMTELKQKSGYSFVYEQQDLDTNRKISVSANSPQEAIQQILQGQNVRYEIKGKNVVVAKAITKAAEPGGRTTSRQHISGTIADELGEPIIGASIIEGDTKNAAISDMNGHFELDVEPGATLKISYVGFKPQSVKASARTLNIILHEDQEALNEVVVIGYGTMKKSDLTSSISSVSAQTISQASTSSISEVLQGKVAGMDIQTDRYEGENRTMYIRGTRSLNASNAPLVIVDGVPGSMTDINVHDIESIEVMKDASSAAIYGSQGANGVILITTKRGKAGTTKIAYDGYYGVRKPIFADMMKGDRFVQMKRDAYLMANNLWTPGNKGTVDDAVLFTPDEQAVIASGDYYDWYDLVYRDGSILSNNVTLTGGNDRTKVKVNVGYDYDKGYVKTNETKSLYLSSSIDHQINKWASVGAVVRYKNRDNSGFATYGQALFYGTPVTKPYNDDGSVIPIPNTNEGAYYILLNYQDGQYANDSKTQRINLLGYIDLKFTKDLTMHTNIGSNITDNRTGYFYGANSYTSHGKNKSGRSAYHDYHLTANNTLTYQHLFDGAHQLTVDFVQEIQKYETDGLNANGENEDVEMLSYYNLGTNLENKNIGSYYSGWSMASLMGRLRYDYKGRYLFNASIREDGSSRLADGHKWGTFISAGAAWRISEEAFMQGTRSWLSNLKLRISYGEVGNQAISVYQTLASLGTYSVLFGENGLYAYRPDRLVNKDLGWERTGTLNVGIDFGFFNNRLSGSVDVYKAKTSDLLMQRSLPTTIGFSQIYDNIGSTENRGVEVNLNASIIESSDFTLDAYGTFAYNKNKITKLATEEDDITNRWFIGKPISVAYDYQKLGIWQTSEVEEAAKYNCVPGDIKIADLEGTSEGITGDDRTFLGQYDPKVIASLGFRLTWKGFDFALNMNGRFGHLIYSDYYGYNLITSGNRWCADVDYWTPDNPTNLWPRAANDIANRGLCAYMKGDYIKLQDLTLGYDFAKIINKTFGLKVSKARLYGQMRNFAYLYKAAGHHVNPESTSTEITVPQSFIVGLNINF